MFKKSSLQYIMYIYAALQNSEQFKIQKRTNLKYLFSITSTMQSVDYQPSSHNTRMEQNIK